MDLRRAGFSRTSTRGMKTGVIAEQVLGEPGLGASPETAASGPLAKWHPRQQRHGQLAGWVKHAEQIREAVRSGARRHAGRNIGSDFVFRCRSRHWPRALGSSRPDAKKKSRSGASEQDRPDVKQQRDEWKAEAAVGWIRNGSCFSTKTWASTKHDSKRMAVAPKAERTGHGCAARPLENDHLRRGVCGSTVLTAPTVVDGPMNGDIFVAYVEQQTGADV